MNIIRRILPDEWISASRSAQVIWSINLETPHPFLKGLVSVALPASLGLLISIKAAPLVNEAFAQGSLTVIGILAGFLMSLMLFTGRLSGTEELTVQETTQYRKKVMYLLSSQALTLATFFITAAVTAAWLMIDSDGGTIQWVASALVVIMTTTCLFRALLLPFHLIELHDFTLTMLVHSKQAELEEKLQRQAEEVKSHDQQ